MEVTCVEQCAYIQIAVLPKRNAMACHSELVEALGNNARTVERWTEKFQQGCVSTSDEQSSGRPVSVWHVPSSSSSWIGPGIGGFSEEVGELETRIKIRVNCTHEKTTYDLPLYPTTVPVALTKT
ncbi:HTH_48 domain-containing protein [Trichonephila clavipes]|uniref:HTH_48 domain-containing protein n=1 Tax=Trichonephila clavipes TaxID=2585209 RepID=A0A8X6T476_TRICX|nr:HTH_48 domain-containing protein [Trichonephila clavipes]